MQSGYFGIRSNDDWIDEILASPDLTREGWCEHAYAVRRDEAARAGRAGFGASATGNRPG